MSNVDVAKIYAYLSKLNVLLNFEDIPTPRFIQDRQAESNSIDWRVDKYALEVTQEHGRIRKLYKTEKLNFDAKKRQLLTNHESIKKLPTGKEREAAVEELLEGDLRTILDLENDMDTLKDLLGAIKMIQDNIKETNSGIRVLMRTMESQINRLNVGTKEDAEVAELHRNLADLDKLEDEITMEDVETSTETPSDDSGDELSEGGHKTSPEENGQETSEKVKIEATASDDPIASFLMDDSEDVEDHISGESTEEEEVIEEEAPAEAPVEVPTNKGPTQATGSKPKLMTGTADIDLSDIGIDIDTSAADEVEISTEEKVPEKKPVSMAPPKTVKSESAVKKEGVPPTIAKKETPTKAPAGPPVKKIEIPKKEITDIDLDEILTSID